MGAFRDQHKSDQNQKRQGEHLHRRVLVDEVRDRLPDGVPVEVEFELGVNEH